MRLVSSMHCVCVWRLVRGVDSSGRNIGPLVEPMTGIEPAYSAWEPITPTFRLRWQATRDGPLTSANVPQTLRHVTARYGGVVGT